MERKSLIIWLLMVGALASAQVSFKAVPDKTTASVGERIQLSFIITTSENVDMEQIVFPSFAGFQMLGRNVGQSVNYNNGKTTRQFMETVVLRPQKQGKITIRGATVKINGELHTSNPVTLTITKAKPKVSDKYKKLVFMDIQLSKDKVYPNETLYASVKLYAKSYDALRRRSDIEVPGLSDFQVKKLSSNEQRDFQQVVVNNQVYIAEQIAEFQLTPKTTGELVIPPFTLRVAIPLDFFDEKIVTVNTDEQKIFVKDLPDNAPKEFSGAVGDFSFATHVEDTEVKTNQSVDYEVELIGEGNLSGIILPKIEAPKELEVYPPKTRNAFQLSLHGEKGKLVDKYVIVPQYGGMFTIPSIRFCFFNPNEEAYKTIQTDEVELHVKGITKAQEEAKQEQQKVLDSIENDTVNAKDNDFLPNIPEEITNIFNEPKNENAPRNPTVSQKPKWWLWLFLIPVLGLILWLIFRKKKKKSKGEDVTGSAKFNSKELKQKMHSDLKQLKTLAQQNQRDAFLEKSRDLLNDVVIYSAQEKRTYDVTEAKKLLTESKSANFVHRWEQLYNQTQMMKYGVVNSELELTQHYTAHEELFKDLLNK